MTKYQILKPNKTVHYIGIGGLIAIILGMVLWIAGSLLNWGTLIGVGCVAVPAGGIVVGIAYRVTSRFESEDDYIDI